MTPTHKLSAMLGITSLFLSTSALAAPFELFNFGTASPNTLRARDVTTNNIDYIGDGNATDGYSRYSFADLGSTPWSNDTENFPLFGGTAAVRVNKSGGYDTYGYGSSINLRVQSNSPLVEEGEPAITVTPSMNPFRLAAFWEVADTDATDLFSIRTNASSLERATGRIMLRNADGNFYVSEATMSTGNFTLDQTSVQNQNWALLDAATWLNDNTFAPVTLNFNVATSTIGTVQGVGFMADRNETNGNRIWVTLGEFEVQAIPEPGTLALVGIALGSLLLFRRRR